MSGALSIRGVSKTYDPEGASVEALRDCSFEVRAEEFVAIVGPSGCGKSTLLNAIAGFDTVSAGEVHLEPLRLYLGDVGHTPAPNPPAEQPVYFGEAVKWFDRFLKGTSNGIDKPRVELAHDPWDGKTTVYPSTPPRKTISVTLPGTTTMSGSSGKVVRSVRVTGGPHETFGDSTVVVRYSGAQSWDRLVAVLAVAGNSTPISVGGTKLTAASGKVTIKLMNESVRFAAGKKLVLYLGSTSLAQDPADALYLAAVAPQAKVTIGRVTLNLSVLKKALSR